jgi:hypothetical protein
MLCLVIQSHILKLSKKTSTYEVFVLRNLQEALNQARNRIAELNSNFMQEMEKKFANSEEGHKRRIEDAESSLDLFRNMNIDLSRIKEHDELESKKAQEILQRVKSKLRPTPKEVLPKVQDQMRIDEILSVSQTVNNPFYERFFINSAIAGLERVFVNHTPSGRIESTQGNCGDITYGPGSPSVMTSWCLAAGSNCSGHGPKMPSVAYGCIDQISVVCSLWFWIPREYLQQSGTLTVTPYFDMHGFYWDRANTVLGLSKEAAIALRMQTNLYRATGPVASTTFWIALNYDGHNIDQSGRFDYTGYNSAATGTMQVPADEPAFVQIVAELDAFVQGAGSMGLLNFNGEGNAIKIPNLMCVLHTQPVNYP